MKARLLSELVRPAPGQDPNELLKHRFLCRCGGMLLLGATGIGKSSLAMQCAILWALGRGCHGIMPARPLKSLLIQAENDDGDLAEMRDGVIKGLGLSQEEAKTACENILVLQEDSRTSFDFCQNVVRPLLEKHRPDLLWIDPALAYLGGEASAQKDVTKFLRNYLNPLLKEFNCAVVIVHHTNKPPSGNAKPDWKGTDFAYLGSGSIEWANWARAILALRGTGSFQVFELMAPKRGSRLGWRMDDGSPCFSKFIAHATEPGAICWREADPDQVIKNGQPKKFEAEELRSLLGLHGMTATEWQEAAFRDFGVKESTFHRLRRELAKQKRIKRNPETHKWDAIVPL